MRPEGWEDAKATIKKKAYVGCWLGDDDKLIEAGAEAMLEGLFQMAKESPTGTFVIDSKEVHIYET